jgi:predicted SAM-dependent methyltransferase
LEHIHSLRKTVKKIASHLNSTGYLVIAVPNPESADAKHYGKDWAGYDVPRHLYHFTEKSMAVFQSEFGMELIRVEPLVYDSYYVSLLSEGYKNPSSGTFSRYLKAFLEGYRSNQRASKPGKYSSNIFIFKKK